jgi:uncharacterized protein
MYAALHIVSAWCGAIPASSGLLTGLFLAGIAGSALHCVPMCGGFVLGQVADRLARMPPQALCEWQRYRTAVLLPYHFGRLTTYAALGAVIGAGGGQITRLPWLKHFPAVLLLLASALFLMHAIKKLAPWLQYYLPAPDHAPAAWNRLIARATRRIDRTRPAGGYLLGVALGFLPCGFLYGALVAAGSTLDPPRAALGMVAFGLGTMPALVVVGLGGQIAGRVWNRAVSRLAPVILLLNASLLGLMAIRTLLT